ncbi:MAG TPA: glycosyltransferase family 2 protein [Chitinophagaceae bacterium]|nr:glycosyltransferase family 2 protein [Chitinophagaceae bacterium]
MQLIGQILFSILFAYLAFGVLFLFVFALAGALKKRKRYEKVERKRNIAVLIPSYREDNIIVNTAMQAASHNYHADHFKVFVIADKLQPETILKLKSIPVNVLEVAFKTSTKSRSLQACINSIPQDQFEIALILDADNVMAKGCLDQVNAAFEKGFEAVQCHRTAKNKNTAISTLDAISEEINNNLFRKGPRVFGLSAALIGSGMAFKFSRLSHILNQEHILDNPGEDREIDMQLMKENVVVEYIDDALVYDEKVSSSAVFQKQRTRWLEAQVTHFKRFFHPDFKSAPSNANYYTKFLQTILLPRSLYILTFCMLAVFFVMAYFFQWQFFFPPLAWWIAMVVMFIVSLLISVPASLHNFQLLKAILHMPVLILAMFRALLKMKKNRVEFLHTPKTHTS